MNEREKLENKLRETLSALLDGEAGKTDQLELRRLARSLDENPELVETYQRYTLARATLKGEPAVASGLFASVHAAIEQENMEEAVDLPHNTSAIKKNPRTAGWLKAMGNVAIAASVAVIAVAVMQFRHSASESPDVAMVKTAMTPAASEQLEQNSVTSSTSRNNRVLNPNVMTVSAGDTQSFGQSDEGHQGLATGCTISETRTDKSNLVWEKNLPAGYVFCKQNSQTKLCESVSTKIGCYLN